MTVFPCGTSVVIGRSGYQGDITAIEIRFELIRYEVTYYVEGMQQRTWVHESELNHATKKKNVGFKNHKDESKTNF